MNIPEDLRDLNQSKLHGAADKEVAHLLEIFRPICKDLDVSVQLAKGIELINLSSSFYALVIEV